MHMMYINFEAMICPEKYKEMLVTGGKAWNVNMEIILHLGMFFKRSSEGSTSHPRQDIDWRGSSSILPKGIGQYENIKRNSQVFVAMYLTAKRTKQQ